MGFGRLRVINDDRVAPGQGFGTHPHRDMEIFSFVLEGALEHRDSLGNGRVLRPGEIQLMSAGTGVTHSEFNPSPKEPVHFLQVWIEPERLGLKPSYTEWRPPPERAFAGKVLVISPDGRDGSATIHQKADVWLLKLKAGQAITHELRPDRHAWLQVADGEMTLNNLALTTGDGAAITEESSLRMSAGKPTQALLFDLNATLKKTKGNKPA